MQQSNQGQDITIIYHHRYYQICDSRDNTQGSRLLLDIPVGYMLVPDTYVPSLSYRSLTTL